jgi:hypothetical protein
MTTDDRSATHSAVIRTADGEMVGLGSRVFDYYDGHWGVIADISDGWFDHIRDEGSRGYLNGERVCVTIPRDNPYYTGKGNP